MPNISTGISSADALHVTHFIFVIGPFVHLFNPMMLVVFVDLQ
jgi:hypothetical protein